MSWTHLCGSHHSSGRCPSEGAWYLRWGKCRDYRHGSESTRLTSAIEQRSHEHDVLSIPASTQGALDQIHSAPWCFCVFSTNLSCHTYFCSWTVFLTQHSDGGASHGTPVQQIFQTSLACVTFFSLFIKLGSHITTGPTQSQSCVYPTPPPTCMPVLCVPHTPSTHLLHRCL